MKLDIDYAIGILAAMEDDDNAIFDASQTFQDYDPESSKYGYHCLMLREAGLIEVWDMRSMGNHMDYRPKRLTWIGHEFIAKYKDKSRLQTVKGKLAALGMEVTIRTLLEAINLGLTRIGGLG